MKCFLCGERKAKRHCPAKNRQICSVCCGEKRGIEIDCPDDCQYFVKGQNYQQKKLTTQRVKKDGAVTYRKRAELYRKNPMLFAKIEYAIVDAYFLNDKLLNKDVVGALDLVHKTLNSESRGLIYKHRSEDSVVNDVADIIERGVNEIKDNTDLRQSVSTNFAKDVVEDFLNEARFYEQENVSVNSYLTHLAKFHKDRPGAKATKSEIIL